MKSMVQSKIFDQNSSKLTAFHIPHTNSRTATKEITIINTCTYTSTKHELLIYPNTSEEKSTVRFKLRMARKILKKAQDKLRNVSSTFSFIMSDEFRAKL